ncbi:MAG: helix-turn-helix transcriptional regulator [Rikenellaceae bacterium]
MLKSVEFFVIDGEIMAYFPKTKKYLTVDATQRDNIIIPMLDIIEKNHHLAYTALSRIYKNAKANLIHYEFLIVSRFIRCNCGVIDNVLDVDDMGNLHYEQVACPLRGICKHENVVCNPKFETSLTPGELRVMELMAKGVNRNEIAKKLNLSEHTINNHVRHAMNKLHLHKMVDFINYAHRNNLFNY